MAGEQNEQFGRRYFDELDYNKTSEAWSAFYERQLIQIAVLTDGKAGKLCDIGCAYGDFLRRCEAAGWTTFGLDVSEHAINRAKQNTKATLAVADAQSDIPFEGPFDAITCFDVVEHLADPGKAMANMSTRLRERGCLILTTPNPRAAVWKRLSKSGREDETHISVKPLREWERLACQSGLEVIRARTFFPLASSAAGAKGLLVRLLSACGLGSTVLIVSRKRAGRLQRSG